MVLKLRLARFGRKNSPFYNIVVAHARTARNSRPLEVLGTYDPTPKKDTYDEKGSLHKDIKLDITRAQYWIGVGAQPTDPVWRILSMIGILHPKRPLPGLPTPKPTFTTKAALTTPAKLKKRVLKNKPVVVKKASVLKGPVGQKTVAAKKPTTPRPAATPEQAVEA